MSPLSLVSTGHTTSIIQKKIIIIVPISIHNINDFVVQPSNPFTLPHPVGRSGWGILWYLNSTLIPIINVTRGNTYTFLIHGGNNASDPSNYHPFYITDSIAGGRIANTPQEVVKCITLYIYTIHVQQRIGIYTVYNLFCVAFAIIWTLWEVDHD